MKKLTLSLIFMIGLCFSFSEVCAQTTSQQDLSVGVATFGKPAGINPKQKDLILQGINEKLQVLSHQMQQSPQQDIASKAIMIEALLYRGMMSDLNSGKAVVTAYDDNLANFLRDYPQFGEYLEKKRLVALDFFNITFFN
jgi:hypothetical protein